MADLIAETYNTTKDKVHSIVWVVKFEEFWEWTFHCVSATWYIKGDTVNTAILYIKTVFAFKYYMFQP